MFLEKQPRKNTDTYKRLLSAAGSLSKLFSESNVPYIHYRTAENLFCKAFEAENKSRSDVSADAVKDNTGIGIKTFRHKGSQFEKIAEFNKNREEYAGLPAEEMIKRVSESRNERIDTTARIYDLSDNIYHCISRKPGEITVYEVPMQTIQTEDIKDVNKNGNIVTFTDGLNDYSFNKSKSTLFKRFKIQSESLSFPVDIIEDPYATLDSLASDTVTPHGPEIEHSLRERIILPLYATRKDMKYVPERSGLNQWNAEGRKRSFDEVYVGIPAWIHSRYPGFFPPREEPFDLVLPNRSTMSAKVCQEGSKALMSNPNSDLGEWLLRKVLDLEAGELLTYSKLQKIGIDSVAIYKNNDGTFDIEFKKLGTYEDFVIRSK